MRHDTEEDRETRVRTCKCGDPDCLYQGRWGADEPLRGYEPDSRLHLAHRPWWKFWGDK